jgi:hypothetical protein
MAKQTNHNLDYGFSFLSAQKFLIFYTLKKRELLPFIEIQITWQYIFHLVKPGSQQQRTQVHSVFLYPALWYSLVVLHNTGFKAVVGRFVLERYGFDNVVNSSLKRLLLTRHE